MGASTPTVYGATWFPDCRRSKQFLGEHQIPCRWVDIETDPESEKLVIEKNQGKRIIPTISSWSVQGPPAQAAGRALRGGDSPGPGRGRDSPTRPVPVRSNGLGGPIQHPSLPDRHGKPLQATGSACDSPFHAGQRVAVIGGGNRAAEESLHLTRFVDHIDLLVGKGHFSASPILSEKVLSHPKITVLWHTEVKGFIGKGGKRSRLQTIDNQTAEEARPPAVGSGHTRGYTGGPMVRKKRELPRVLVVTPEVTYLPDRMGSISGCLRAKAGGLADVSAALVCELYRQGADVHVAIPNYRAIFGDCLSEVLRQEQRAMRRILPEERLHLAEDHAFAKRLTVYAGDSDDNIRLSLAFQREVINTIIPRVAPDLIHCNDWMTGLIPAAAGRMGIPSLFSVHNVHTMEILLSVIEERGIDPTVFWDSLYFGRMPDNYENSRFTNPVDLLVSGVFAAKTVTVVSPTFLSEIISGVHDLVSDHLQNEMLRKWESGAAAGILNAPDPSFDPSSDPHLAAVYGPDDALEAKAVNKLALQEKLGLAKDPSSPLVFWPSRLDPVQKGCQLLSDIFYQVMFSYREEGLQVVFVADGAYQQVFRDIRAFHGFEDRVAVIDYNGAMEHLGYGAADFILMPSRFEPCGLPQMIGAIYGALPVVHAVGGLRDTVRQLDTGKNSGNGFLFETYDTGGLRWAIDQAMAFHRLPGEAKAGHIRRIMTESAAAFNHKATARRYIERYQGILQRPVTDPSSVRSADSP
jgi:starch synthase/alpha-amylase